MISGIRTIVIIQTCNSISLLWLTFMLIIRLMRMGAFPKRAVATAHLEPAGFRLQGFSS